jgi:nucleotide-binding universal stress UspA family protein
MIDLRRILVPTDFSPYSEVALTYAGAFAEKFHADLFLLHVVQDLALFVPDLVGAAPPLLPTLEQLTTPVREAFDRLVAEHHLQHLPIHPEVREGTPAAEIVRLAKEQEIDLIVMGTHGHTGLAHVLLGSVTEKVVRQAPCPVLTVHHPEHEFVRP